MQATSSGTSLGGLRMPSILLSVLLLSLCTVCSQAESNAKRNDKVSTSVDDAAAIARHLLEQQKLLMAEQNALVKRLESLPLSMLGSEQRDSSGTCDGGGGDSDDGYPFVSFTVLVTGCGFLAKLIHMEYRIYSEKMQTDSARQETILISEFLQYRLDYYFSSTQWAKPLLLLYLTFILILASSIVLMFLLGDNLSAAMWKAWTYVADPGTHAETDGTFGRVIAFGTTIGGMLVFALMIGVISDSIGEKVDDLKKGKSKVIEVNHTLVLGWSEKGLAILRQLALANMSEGGQPVVVLCEQGKEEMEEMLRAAESSKDDGLKLYGTRVIFRSGNPLAEHDLVKVSAAKARSIIALSPDGLQPDAADSRMVRQVLSLEKIKQMPGGGLRGHIVVELQDVDNRALVQMVGKGDVEVIVSHDLIGRMMLLSARSPWLATVLDDLMGFDGSEFYLKEWKEFVNKPFGSVLFRFDDAVPVGLKYGKTGRIQMNPPDDTIIQEGDEILVLAEDDDKYCLNDNDIDDYEGTRPDSELVQKKESEKPPERLLFCGWRRDMADMICELDYDVPPNSELWLFNNVPMEERAVKLLDKGNKSQLKLKNITMKHVVGNPVIRRELISLVEVSDGQQNDGFAIGDRTGRREVLNYFTSILILSDCSEEGDEVNSEASDSRSVATTLIIQDIQRGISERKSALGEPCELSPPISEILDSRTRSLMQLINKEGYQGYVLSNHLVASALAMVSEDRYMNKVYGELLSCQGNQIQIRKARDYINIAKEEMLSFWDVACLARMSEEIAIGYIPVPDASTEADKPTVLLNPANKAQPRLWKAQDRIIVIGMCRQAKYKAELRAARSKAESDLYKQFSSGGNEVPIHGWLKKLNSGKENEMDDDAHWRDRLCFVMNGKMAYASEKKKGETEPVCDLAKIKSIQPGNGWPPGYNTFKLDIENSKSMIFSANTPQECGKWIMVLQKYGKR